MTTLNAKSTAAAVLEKVDGLVDEVKTLREQNTTLREQVVAIKEKAAAAVYPPGFDPRIPFGVSGAIPKDSEGYSVLRAARLATRGFSPEMREKCKYEWKVHQELGESLQRAGWRPTEMQGCANFLVPFCTKHLSTETSAEERFVGELRHKMVGAWGQPDPDEVASLRQKMGFRQKDLGTLSDNAGGVLLGFPTLMELVDIQRNLEVFPRAGATETALPANGQARYPKLTGTTTAFWVGEANAVTESTPATGYLDLVAKKLGILVDLNNELLRFASPSAEAMVRMDMAKVGALKADLAMLEGTGGTQIKGLITYPAASSWTTGTDPLLTYTVTSNLIQIKDAAEMEAIMPDTAGEPTAWVMRRQLWAKVRNRRADAVTAADAAGPFLTGLTRDLSQSIPLQFEGVPVVRSSQVSATRGGGTQTYVILGHFPDWIIARFGVMEFLSSNVGDTQMVYDQTRLRAIQHLDAGPRHASSFVFADAVNIA